MRLAVLLIGILFCNTGVSASSANQLAKNPVWLSLLHYESGWFGNDSRSAIVSKPFFLAPDGNVSPEKELEATIDAFLNDRAESTAQCKYPARFLWLQPRVKRLSEVKMVRCAGFDDWVGDTDITSASMVFAAGHMKSPASYFGHNFLKFNSAGDSNFLLDHTVNYGADVPPEHGAVPYLYNGIFGGYQATYESQQFFRHMALYGEQDLRDLWEYVLDLGNSDVQLLLKHAWELKRQKLTYYFFRENCAYHIARLLGLVNSETLVPSHMPWTMPYNVMARLAEAQHHGRPLVKDIVYHPSRRSRFQRGFLSLSASQKKAVIGTINSPFPAVPLRLEVPSDSAVAIIDTLVDYYELALRVDDADESAKEAKRQLLLARFSYPPSPDLRVSSDKPYPPHLAQKPGYVSFGFNNNQSVGNELELGLRPAYFDFLSHDIGRRNTGNFTLLDTRLRFTEDSVRVQTFNLMDISNVVPSTPGIAADVPLSWRFRAGFDQTNNACDDCLRPMLDWQIGRAWQGNKNLTLFAMTGVRVQQRFKYDNPLVLKTTLGITGQLGNSARMYASIGRHEDTGSSGRDRNPLSVQLRLGNQRGWDVRFQYNRDIAEDFKLAIGAYW